MPDKYALATDKGTDRQKDSAIAQSPSYCSFILITVDDCVSLCVTLNLLSSQQQVPNKYVFSQSAGGAEPLWVTFFTVAVFST